MSLFQEYPAVSAVELLVRANITVKSSIQHLVLQHAATQVLREICTSVAFTLEEIKHPQECIP